MSNNRNDLKAITFGMRYSTPASAHPISESQMQPIGQWFHDEFQSPALPLAFDFAEIEARTLAHDPQWPLRCSFAAALRAEDKNLFYKWLYEGHLTNSERDLIAMVARKVRRG